MLKLSPALPKYLVTKACNWGKQHLAEACILKDLWDVLILLGHFLNGYDTKVFL